MLVTGHSGREIDMHNIGIFWIQFLTKGHVIVYRKDIIKAEFYEGKDVIFGKLESSKEDEKKLVQLALSRIDDHSQGPTI